MPLCAENETHAIPIREAEAQGLAVGGGRWADGNGLLKVIAEVG